MKTFKHIFVFILLMVFGGLLNSYLGPNSPIWVIIIFLISGFFIINLIIRKNLSFKNYFVSPYNLFTTKIHRTKIYEIPKDLMFEKIIEVIEDSTFKLVDKNNEKLEILATSPVTFKSWGENLYISFERNENNTIMKFCSTTFFQMYSWGKNEKNYNDLLNSIEKSLTI